MSNFEFKVEVEFGYDIKIRRKSTGKFDLQLVKNFKFGRILPK